MERPNETWQSEVDSFTLGYPFINHSNIWHIHGPTFPTILLLLHTTNGSVGSFSSISSNQTTTLPIQECDLGRDNGKISIWIVDIGCVEIELNFGRNLATLDFTMAKGCLTHPESSHVMAMLLLNGNVSFNQHSSECADTGSAQTVAASKNTYPFWGNKDFNCSTTFQQTLPTAPSRSHHHRWPLWLCDCVAAGEPSDGKNSILNWLLSPGWWTRDTDHFNESIELNTSNMMFPDIQPCDGWCNRVSQLSMNTIWPWGGEKIWSCTEAGAQVVNRVGSYAKVCLLNYIMRQVASTQGLLMTNGAYCTRGKLHHSPWHSDICTTNQLNTPLGLPSCPCQTKYSKQRESGSNWTTWITSKLTCPNSQLSNGFINAISHSCQDIISITISERNEAISNAIPNFNSESIADVSHHSTLVQTGGLQQGLVKQSAGISEVNR